MKPVASNYALLLSVGVANGFLPCLFYSVLSTSFLLKSYKKWLYHNKMFMKWLKP